MATCSFAARLDRPLADAAERPTSVWQGATSATTVGRLRTI
ncbi:MAG: hypothetical protein M0Z42_15260 [Actinomycetota bacterium]|nr:hypothetical protein [Actinomycetota bacterium]